MNSIVKDTTWVTHPWVTERSSRTRFGILLADPGDDWARCRDFAQYAEDLGFSALWVPDHPGMGFSDGWTMLATLATATKTIRLGTSVSCIFYRSPWLLARMAADVDRLSNGRLVLGLGIGDAMDEFRQFAVPIKSIGDRQKALEEAIHIVQGLWSGQPFTYDGQFFQLQQACLLPGPVQQPHIPLLIGGGGERVTLRQVAQYANVSNFAAHAWAGSAFTFDDITRKLAALRSHCETFGRPYDSVLRSYATMPLILAQTASQAEAKKALGPEALLQLLETSTVTGTPSQVIPYYQALVDLGINYFIAAVLPGDQETLELLAHEVIPALTPVAV